MRTFARPSLPALTATELRQWREMHGWSYPAVARALGWAETSLWHYEHGRNTIPARLAQYVAVHPAPAAVERYSADVAGLRAAIAVQFGSHAAWCRWWGVPRQTFYRWLNGTIHLPLAVRAWLRAGAPIAWERRPPGETQVPPGVVRPRRVNRPAPHAPCGNHSCLSCAQRRAWQAGKYAGRRTQLRWDGWTPVQDSRLHELAGQHHPQTIAAMLSEEFGIPRSANGVLNQLKKLHVSQQLCHFSGSQVAYLLGFHDHVVVRVFIRRGWLHAEQPGGKHGPFLIRAADLETFLETYPAVYDWRRMPPSRWRDRAQIIHHRDPLYTLAETAQFLARSLSYVRSLCARGRLAALAGQRRRTGGRPMWMIPRSALLAYQRAQEAVS